MADVVFKLNLRTDEAKAEVAAAILKTVIEVFELDIKPAAVENSPAVTGTNRRSIDTEVSAEGSQVNAEIFSQSGYGGYLEVGTYKMAAQPYMGPAFQEGIASIPEKLKEKL